MTAVNLRVREGFCKSQYKSLQTTRCWSRVWSVLLLFVALSLLLFSLYGRHGEFIISSEKIIGLHKQCFQNKTTGEMECFKHDRIKMNIHTVGVEISKVLVFSALVFCLFALLSFGLSPCCQDSNDRHIWKCGVSLVAVAAASLFAGVISFMLCAATKICVADIGLALWMCMAAEAVLIADVFVSWRACREQDHCSIAVVI